jgi:hypothetical protein
LAQGRPDGCGRATARAALVATKVRLDAAGDRRIGMAPRRAHQVICFDFTRDERVDLAVTIASGGTGGNLGFIVFRHSVRGWVIALKRSGHKFRIARVGGDVVASQAVYRHYKNGEADAMCCPTGGFDHERFHWNGVRFVRVRAWHTERSGS